MLSLEYRSKMTFKELDVVRKGQKEQIAKDVTDDDKQLLKKRSQDEVSR